MPQSDNPSRDRPVYYGLPRLLRPVYIPSVEDIVHLTRRIYGSKTALTNQVMSYDAGQYTETAA